MKNTQFLGRAFILSAISSTLILSGCGRQMPQVTAVGSGVGTAPAVGGNLGNSDGGFSQPNSSYGSTLPQPSQPESPTDTPEPLPAPKNPVKPGEPIIAKAVANTTAFAVPRLSKWFQVNGVYVHIHLTWQPVNGAAEYWVYKGKIPAFAESRREFAYATVPAGGATAGFKDGLEAPNLKAKNIWESIKRGVNMITNRPGVTYEYKVVAVDGNGVPMSESKVVKSQALPAISAPVLNEVQDTDSRTPYFSWKDSANASRPDGYYISVFPSVNFSNGSLPPTAVAYWTGYRSYRGEKFIRYGADKSNLAAYPGTLPFDITFDLGAGKHYSWTAIAIDTDTGDMRNANAISRAWSGFGHFQISPDAGASNVAAQSMYRSAVNAFGRWVGVNPQQQQRAQQPTYQRQSAAYPQQQYPQQQAYPQQGAPGVYPQYPQQQRRAY